jgi:hypothetical protein
MKRQIIKSNSSIIKPAIIESEESHNEEYEKERMRRREKRSYI